MAETKGKDKKPKKRVTKKFGSGLAFIKSTFNNNLVTITDPAGNVVASCSSGALNFRGNRKDTPYAAQMVAETAGKKAKDMGINQVAVFVKGTGTGREAAIRAFPNVGIEVTSIKDVSGIPFNGCRPSKPRRI